MSIIRLAGIKKHSFVDGPGIRFAVFTQGCPHACPFCHNQDTWDKDAGCDMEIAELIREIKKARFLDGITISGGEPLLQPHAVLEVAGAAKEMGLSVFLYTGWTYEALIAGTVEGIDVSLAHEILAVTDVMVDGRFIMSRRYLESADKDGNPYYRGSDNQRLIDCKESLRQGKCVRYEQDRALRVAN